jgi:pimeloyl-ACP methyl ester carboxylesterase
VTTGDLLAHRVEGEGEPLLLLNGGLMTYAAWEPLSARLRRRHRLVLCDLRGQLLSPGLAPSDLTGNVADLTALLDHLGIEAVHVLGASYGGEIALLLAALAPRRVRSLVAVTVADYADETMRADSEAWRELLAAAADKENRGRFYEHLVESVYSDAFRERFGKELAARRSQVAAMPDDWWRSLQSIFEAVASLDLRPHLGAIRCPAMIVSAASDRLMPSGRSLALAAAIAGAETNIHESSGHALVAEDPAWLARVSLDFLARHALDRQGRAAATER